MVEASMVLSVFFVLVLAMIEMSQMGMTTQLISSAANAGCRVAVVNGYSQADVTSAVSTRLAAGGISSSSYTLTTSPANVTTTHLGDSVTVAVSVPLGQITWFGTPRFLGSATVTSTATMSSERP